MTLLSYWRTLGTAGRTARRFVVPRCELLEDRTLPSTFTVMNLNDSGPGSLRAAVAAANANPGADTIVFTPGLHGTIGLTSGELLITDSGTINGPEASRLAVSGTNAGRVFEIAAGFDVALNGLTVTHGYAFSGGGILNDGSNLTLSADVLSQNVAGFLGGGLDSEGGNLTITGCTISGNLAHAGAQGCFGGGISVRNFSFNSITVTISNSTFSGNQAVSYDTGTSAGGGIAANSVLGPVTVTISNSTFSGNQAVGGNGGFGNFYPGVAWGGAISTQFASVTISGSTFDHNQALAGSNGNLGTGAIFVDYAFGGAINAEFLSSVTVTNSRFSYNQAVGGNNATATGTDIVGVGGAEGAAILSQVGCVAEVAGCTFDHNAAIGGNGNTGSGAVALVGEGLGGAIVSGYGSSELGFPNLLTVSNSTFSQNEAVGGDKNTGTASVAGLVGTGAGAGIANYAGGTASVSASALDSNEARGGRGNTAGGGVVFAGVGAGAGLFNYLGSYNSTDFGPLGPSVLTVSGCTIDSNQATGGDGAGLGGGLFNSDTTTVANSSVTNNLAAGGGNGAGLGGGLYNAAASSVALTHCVVTQNQAKGSPGIGGGVYNLGLFAFDALTVIKDNKASTSGDNIGP
jgi:hypothetical protein